jgi:hypothetical protein
VFCLSANIRIAFVEPARDRRIERLVRKIGQIIYEAQPEQREQLRQMVPIY